ncbi:MAG: ThuA domain-containing protein [Fimbriimonadaceae bacterium]|nr:ThuA domain-containing protein [Fimbriimonadaceae bacterium]
MLSVLLATATLSAGDWPLDEAALWLRAKAQRMIRESRRVMADGTAAFPPQVGANYDAFWLRDFAYQLEGCPAAFSAAELRAAARLFVAHGVAAGAGVDCIAYDGRSIMKPGWGTMGEQPVADGGPFTVDVVWRTWRATADADLVRELWPGLLTVVAAIPRQAGTGLVWIDPARDWERCPYGFTDTVRKTGAELFCSLLLWRALGQLADLAALADAAAEPWAQQQVALGEQIRATFWQPTERLFRAATGRCNQPDLWGSAWAVHLGVADAAQTQAVAARLRDDYAGIVQAGQLRHLPAGTWWELAGPREQYQNGGFWATPSGWLIDTLDRVDPDLATRTLGDLVADFQAHGVWENVLGDQRWVPDYNASAALPLAGLAALRARRQETTMSATFATTTQLKVAVLTGEHPFDVPAFLELWRSLERLAVYPQTLEDWATDVARVRQQYDVVVFYNMHRTLPGPDAAWPSRAVRAALEQLGTAPQGYVMLHHGLLAYPDWDLFTELTGLPQRLIDAYHHDVPVATAIADPAHPITAGLAPWTMLDETYETAEPDAASHLLLTTATRPSMAALAWTRTFRGRRVFCYQAGHDAVAFGDPNFRVILDRAIRWVAGKL